MSRRQDPVSCSLCRRKKLRCSRQQPCSNCIARGVPCEREYGLPNPDDLKDRTKANSPAQVQDPNNTSDVVRRLQRLEDLLLRVDAKVNPTATVQTPNSLAYYSTQQHTPADQPINADADETEVAHQADTRILDNIGTKDNMLLVKLSNELSYGIAHTNDIAAGVGNGTSQGQVILPFRSQAVSLLNVYHQHIEYLHHVTYRPLVRKTLAQVYDAIEADGTPSHDSAALLLAIFSSSAALQFAIAPHEDILGIPGKEAHALCTIWAKGAFDCLDHSRRLGLTSLEGLQAAITVFFLMYNLEGFSARSRFGVASGLAAAKDLGLHRLDHPDSASTGLSKTELEVRRRIWWHSVATDWQLSVSGGPQEGTYYIQPRHIATKLPRHIEEEDLETQDADFERPLSEPTASSYLMQRIKLAEICRHISDAMPLGSLGADAARYNDVLGLDGEFQRFLDNLPPFFQNTPQAREQYKELYTERPSILVQKFTVNMICQTRRCRLHQPYLVRGFTNPTYAQSRDVCLKSARIVIDIKRELDTSRATAASLLALSGIHHHMFFAVVALVMDLCFNKTDDSNFDAIRMAEVREALGILEQAKDRSPVAKRFLDSLMDVMRRHKVKLINAAPAGSTAQSSAHLHTSTASSSAVDQSTENTKVEDSLGVSQLSPPGVPLPMTLTDDFDISCLNEQHSSNQSDFDEIWQSYIEHGPNFDVPDWDELFSDLQMQLK